jgi:hypothetical protein
MKQDATLYMTPSELKVHEQTLADEKAGIDPYGDANDSVLDKPRRSTRSPPTRRA